MEMGKRPPGIHADRAPASSTASENYGFLKTFGLNAAYKEEVLLCFSRGKRQPHEGLDYWSDLAASKESH